MIHYALANEGQQRCRICGKVHAYVTLKHRVLVGGKADMRKASTDIFKQAKVVKFDPRTSDISSIREW
jgi:hypothetical protein